MSYDHGAGVLPCLPPRPDPAGIRRLDDEIAANRQRRRARSLQTCHRPAFKAESRGPASETKAYVPQFSARLLNDPALSDGARRCAIKLLELAYRRDRAGRNFRGTVSYLAKALGRSERAVQTYLAQLRGRGYIRHEVLTSERARMCIGVLITLLKPLFAAHHEASWPVHAKAASMNSGVKGFSENYRPDSKQRRGGGRMSAEQWALACMNGVFRALMKDGPALYSSFA